MSEITSECLFGADATKRAGARVWGEMLLRGVNGPRQLGKAAFAGHLQAAGAGNARDLERVVSARGSAIAKAVEESVAGHEDRADRAHALTAAQHRELAREHEVRQYAEFSDGNLDGARAHRAAADAHHRAAALASDRDSDAPFASHRAREATRHANRRCREQVHLPGHASKAAGGDGFSRPAGRVHGSDTNFGSQAVREEQFREPRPLDPFHSSGQVSGGPREAGDAYPADRPVHPLAFLLDPANDPRSMNWSGSDRGFGPHSSTRPEFGDLNWHRNDGIDDRSRGEMTEGRVPQYQSDQPYPGYAGSQRGRSFEELLEGKAAGIAPGESLTAFAKRLMSGSAETPLAKSLDSALAHKQALGESCWHDFVAMVDRRHELLKGADGASRWGQWQRSDVHRSLVSRIERAPLDPSVRAGLLAAIA